MRLYTDKGYVEGTVNEIVEYQRLVSEGSSSNKSSREHERIYIVLESGIVAKRMSFIWCEDSIGKIHEWNEYNSRIISDQELAIRLFKNCERKDVLLGYSMERKQFYDKLDCGREYYSF